MQQLLRVTATGEEHGLIKEYSNSVPDDEFKRFQPKHREEMKKKKEDEARIVRARYINHRGNHERLTKPYCLWAGDRIQVWHLIPGEEYDLPYGFIQEVNNSGMPKRSKLDADDPNHGNTNLGLVEGKDKIHELVPVNF